MQSGGSNKNEERTKQDSLSDNSNKKIGCGRQRHAECDHCHPRTDDGTDPRRKENACALAHAWNKCRAHTSAKKLQEPALVHALPSRNVEEEKKRSKEQCPKCNK